MAIPQALRDEMVEIIDERLADADGFVLMESGNRRAITYLQGMGALVEFKSGVYWATVHATHVRWQLIHPRLVWPSNNWFSVSVLAVTALVGVGTIVSNIF